MKVNFNPSCNYSYKQASFGKSKDADAVKKNFTEQEIKRAKTKKAVSECITVATGVAILYFAMKHNIKINKIRNHERRLREIASQEMPKIKMDFPQMQIENFL